MKKRRYQKRFYRSWVDAHGLYTARLCVQETDLQILTDIPVNIPWARRRILDYRGAIEKYISRAPSFLTSLKPVFVEQNAHPIVRDMALQARKANVGPMAAVAGAIAQFLGRDLLRKGCREAIVENGGDIFLKITRRRRIGIYAGRSVLSRKLALIIAPQKTALGICTSSGTVGHSLSFGAADSVTIVSSSAALSDAVATATANRVSAAADIPKAIDFAHSIGGIRGVVVIMGKAMGAWGAITLG